MSIQFGLKERVGYSKIKKNNFVAKEGCGGSAETMKRLTAFLLTFVMLVTFCFTGCSKIEPRGNESKKGTDRKASDTKDLTISEAGKTAKISIQIEDNEGNCKVQIPKFESSTQSAAIDEINKKIDEIIVDFYNTAKSRKNEWPLISTRNFDYDRYLQSVVQFEAFPDIEGASVSTFVYDKYQDKALTLEDTYTSFETNENKLQKGVERARITNDNASINNFEVQGFMFTKSGDIQYFVKYEYDSGMDAVNELMTYTLSDENLHEMTSDGVYIAE